MVVVLAVKVVKQVMMVKVVEEQQEVAEIGYERKIWMPVLVQIIPFKYSGKDLKKVERARLE